MGAGVRKHCACATKRFISVQKTSTVTDAMKALPTENMFLKKLQ